MSIASPKEKNRYLFSTAWLYALRTFSRPANAATSARSVLFGRWKFVMMASTALNL